MKKISIVVVHFKNQQLTQKCLESLGKVITNNLSLQIIVVNNNPLENLDKLAERFKSYFFIETGKNLGFAGGNNFGIKVALQNQADWVMLLNNDAFVSPDLLFQFISCIESKNNLGILGPKIYFAKGCEYHYHRYQNKDRGKVFWYAGGKIDWENILVSHQGVDEVDHGQYNRVQETDFVSGCTMLVKREVFEKVGYLDENYYLYLEDADFCQRAKKKNFKVFYCPNAVLWHANAGSSEVGGSLHDYFFTRNRLLFGLRYASFRAKIALVKESMKLLVSGRKWQRIGVKDFYLRKLGQGSWNG